MHSTFFLRFIYSLLKRIGSVPWSPAWYYVATHFLHCFLLQTLSCLILNYAYWYYTNTHAFEYLWNISLSSSSLGKCMSNFWNSGVHSMSCLKFTPPIFESIIQFIVNSCCLFSFSFSLWDRQKQRLRVFTYFEDAKDYPVPTYYKMLSLGRHKLMSNILNREPMANQSMHNTKVQLGEPIEFYWG